MKTFLLLLTFLIGFSYSFAQKKNDTVKTHSLNYYTDISINSDFNMTDLVFLWQSDISFGLNYKRHSIFAGITGGPGVKLFNHYNDNNHIDYLGYETNLNKWGILGGNISYQYQFNRLESQCRRNIIFYFSLLRYREIEGNNLNPNFLIYTKQLFFSQIGYTSSRKVSETIRFEFQVLSGIIDNVDKYPNAFSEKDNIRLHKLFPTLMLRLIFSFKL